MSLTKQGDKFVLSLPKCLACDSLEPRTCHVCGLMYCRNCTIYHSNFDSQTVDCEHEVNVNMENRGDFDLQLEGFEWK